jgi:hypothetical protein
MGGLGLASGFFSLPYAAKEAIPRLFAHHHGLLKMYFFLTRGYIPGSASGGPSVPLHGCSGADRVAANIVHDWLYVIRVLAKLIQGDNLSRHRNDIVLVSF